MASRKNSSNVTTLRELKAQLRKVHNQLADNDDFLSRQKFFFADDPIHAEQVELKRKYRALETKIKNMEAQDARNKGFSHSPFASLSSRKNARRNASFTGLSGHGSGSRKLVDAFYALIDAAIPGSTPVPIPPLKSVHPNHDEETQIFIFADYAVRKFAPIALAAARSRATFVARNAADAAAHSAASAETYARTEQAEYHRADLVARNAADAAVRAAKLNPEATWAAVNEMLAEL
jgi:hypothetical protein